MRRRGLGSTNSTGINQKSQIRQRGYMLITLMLAFALMAMAMLAVLPDIKQQILRDREDELRHRGTAYMRAIQHFYKKFGRYPNSVEELENTNNLRFLRKRYTDPVNIDPKTGKERDFKFLHQQDITLNSGLSLGQTPGSNGIPGQGGLQGQSGSGGIAQGGFGGTQGGVGNFGGQGGIQQQAGAGSQASANSNSDSSSPDKSSDHSSDTDETSDSSGSSSGSGTDSNSGSGLSGPTFGGGPILGVASTSKAKTIRVFNDKSHYNDWLFVYLPQADRGGLLTGPVSVNGPRPAT